MEIAIESIRLDGGTQPRAEIDMNVVQDYALSMMEEVQFPSVTLFYDGTDYWLADGFHRIHAAKQICKETIDADIRQGTRRDAVLHSVGANATHGLRRTNIDKRRSVETLLRDEEWAKWNNSEIARQCNVDHKTVASLRVSYLGNSQDNAKVERNGTTYTMNTSSIGQRTTTQEYTPQPTFYDIPDEDEVQAVASPLDLPNYQPSIRSIEPTPPLPPLETSQPEDRSHFMQLMSSSETPEWYTPDHIIGKVLQLFGEIDLDPCSNSHEAPNVPAKTVYTREDDGLAQPWYGRVYCNPPYGGEIPQWTTKLIQEFSDGRIEEAIALVPGRIDTGWFQPLYDHLICTIKGRLQFSGVGMSAPFPSVAVYLGPRQDDFIRVFSTLGPIVKKVS